MVDNIVVRELVKKLRTFRDTAMSVNKGGLIRSNLIPPSVREDAAKIFLEHGGLDILMDILHVSADQIREWSRNIKADPQYYSQIGTKGIVNGMIYENNIPKKRKRSKPQSCFAASMNGPLLRKCEELREQVFECRSANNGGYTFELKKKIAKIIQECGDYKAVAKIIGISEKTLANWRYFFADRGEFSNEKKSAEFQDISEIFE